MIEYIIIAAIALALGCAIGYLIFRYIIKGKYNQMLDTANKEAEVLKEKKLLEVKEKFLKPATSVFSKAKTNSNNAKSPSINARKNSDGANKK